MADTYFDLEASLNNEENLVPPDSDEDCLENEEEYDALNDETFGTLEDESSLDDWEQQHEQFASSEKSKNSTHLENSLSQKLLDDSEDRLSLSSSVWSYTPTPKNGDAFNTSITSSLQNTPKSFNETQAAKSLINLDHVIPSLPAQLKKICTVEELEKSLISSSRNALASPQLRHPQQGQVPPPRPLLPPPGHAQGPSYHPMMQQPRIPPPGLMPMGMPPQAMRHLNPGVLPPGMLRVMPPHFQFMQGNGPPRPPGFMYPPGGNPNQFPANPYNYPPPLRNFNNMTQGPQSSPHHHQQQLPQHQLPQQQQLQQQQYLQQQLLLQQKQQQLQPQQQKQQLQPQQHQQKQQQKQRNDSGNYGRHYYPGDDHVTKNGYCGMMTLREKQWLLNIQMLQLNTGTPYFDDYYYTIYKENKHLERNKNHQKRQHRNSDRQENSLTPRVYTPLQFENSLGKLQCGSVTAPRKIIDMDIVTPDKDSDGSQVSRDVRRTKQLLLELEALYALLLKAEDINNPLYVSNTEKLREIKQKQRLRELELASTPEQKQEVLRLFRLESTPVVENQRDYILKIVQGLLQEDKFSSFLNIRKGKMLILRLLTHLRADMFPTQLTELWNKILLSLPTVGRRDTAGDNILPKFYPFFKRFVQTRNIPEILVILNGLEEVVRQENNRSTPLSHVGKPPLYFVLLNKFGVSALVSALIRAELVMSVEAVSEEHLASWSDFLAGWARQAEAAAAAAAPMEPVPPHVLARHCDRFDGLGGGRKAVLHRHLAAPEVDA